MMTKLQESSKYFHSLDKNCKIIPHLFFVRRGKETYKIHDLFCNTHDIETCYCGWEWSFHYGTESKTLKNGRRTHTYQHISDFKDLISNHINRIKQHNI